MLVVSWWFLSQLRLTRRAQNCLFDTVDFVSVFCVLYKMGVGWSCSQSVGTCECVCKMCVSTTVNYCPLSFLFVLSVKSSQDWEEMLLSSFCLLVRTRIIINSNGDGKWAFWACLLSVWLNGLGWDEWVMKKWVCHWIVQHFRFFFSVTCSTCGHLSLGGTTMPCCTSTTPGATFAGELGPLDCRAGLLCKLADLLDVSPFVELLCCWSAASTMSLVGVMGLPSFIRLTIMSASRLSSDPGRKGLSISSSVLFMFLFGSLGEKNKILVVKLG